MKYLLVKDKKKRKLVQKFELKRLMLKYILFDINFSKNVKEHINFIFNNLKKNSSKTQIRNRCVVTNRVRSLYIIYKISRLEFKRLAVLGKLSGVFRKIW